MRFAECGWNARRGCCARPIWTCRTLLSNPASATRSASAQSFASTSARHPPDIAVAIALAWITEKNHETRFDPGNVGVIDRAANDQCGSDQDGSGAERRQVG